MNVAENEFAAAALFSHLTEAQRQRPLRTPSRLSPGPSLPSTTKLPAAARRSKKRA